MIVPLNFRDGYSATVIAAWSPSLINGDTACGTEVSTRTGFERAIVTILLPAAPLVLAGTR